MVMDSTAAETMQMAMGVNSKCGPATGSQSVSAAESMVTKSLDNIVGSLWQARQESSGSSMGNQSPRNGEDLSDGEPGSPDGRSSAGDRGGGGAGGGGGGGGEGHARETTPEVGERDGSSGLQGGIGGVRLKDPRDLIRDAVAGGSLPSDLLDKDAMARSLLSGLPQFPALEAFHRQREMLNSPHNFLSAAAAAGLRTPPSLIPPPLPPGGLAFPPVTTSSPSPSSARPPSQPPTPSSQQSGGGSGSPVQNSFTSQQNWSFEEQFKQLYEIDDNPKRKEFLDELFSFMQKRGTPINRLPIMAKQVLDLYELYNLVIARGGLVEVINKKLWQEVIKGLGLPSSITSAAFTLRTQYTKYLYPVECLKVNLSNPNDLQQAIEGNKREGRRSSYGTYPDMATAAGLLAGLPPPPGILGMGMPNPFPGLPSAPPTSVIGAGRHAHFNGNGQKLQAQPLSPPLPPTSSGPPSGDHLAALEMTRLALWKMYNQTNGKAVGGNGEPILPPVSLPNLPALPSELLAQHAAQAAQAAQQAAASAQAEKSLNQQLASERKRVLEKLAEDETDVRINARVGGDDGGESPSAAAEIVCDDDVEERRTMSPPPPKRARGDEDEETEEEEVAVGGGGSGIGADHRRVEDGLDEDDEESRQRMDAEELAKKAAIGLLPGANIKITSRGDARNGGGVDGSLVVSMEINGTAYQGVLFAQPARNGRAMS